MEPTLDLFRHVMLFTMLVVALYTELAHRRVDNFCTYAGVLLGLAIHASAAGWGKAPLRDLLSNPDRMGLENALLGGGAAFAIFFPIFCLGGLMGGEVKLMTAVGVLSGLCVTLNALVLVTAVGAAMALGLMIWKGRLSEGLRDVWHIVRTLGRQPPPARAAVRLTIPYAVAIAAGTTWSWWLNHA